MEVLFLVSLEALDPLCPNYITASDRYRFDLMLLWNNANSPNAFTYHFLRPISLFPKFPEKVWAFFFFLFSFYLAAGHENLIFCHKACWSQLTMHRHPDCRKQRAPPTDWNFPGARDNREGSFLGCSTLRSPSHLSRVCCQGASLFITSVLTLSLSPDLSLKDPWFLPVRWPALILAGGGCGQVHFLSRPQPRRPEERGHDLPHAQTSTHSRAPWDLFKVKQFKSLDIIDILCMYICLYPCICICVCHCHRQTIPDISDNSKWHRCLFQWGDALHGFRVYVWGRSLLRDCQESHCRLCLQVYCRLTYRNGPLYKCHMLVVVKPIIMVMMEP